MNAPVKIQLKVCGMRAINNIREVAVLHPDYMGFIFYRKSKRFVGDDFTIPPGFPTSIKKVGVFVNEGTEQMVRTAKIHALDFIQLHGNEPVKQCKELNDQGYRTIKVFHVDKDYDFKETSSFKKAVDYFMFDTRDKDYGGSGRTFPWEILETYNQEIPFFLSGGISTENIGQAMSLRNLNIHALDVNSGVEREPGLKDVLKIGKLKNEMMTL